ncbi:MAG: hypothetical protein HY692_04860, partial [Cyanobacteria bacterium NC_groundwater_1444_Ag_S-0.65um_54_12]|nr:hypothetical protein [Cyanobacteria bacterium NC_groundwater_1444_Ag_S-0.65um_54_12]
MRFYVALVLGMLELGNGIANATVTSYLIVPMVGDTLRYVLSNGNRADLEVISLKQHNDQLIATIRQTCLASNGDITNQGTFDVIRTEDALALDIPGAGDNARLTPLVYFFAPARLNDSWLAQQGFFLDTHGLAIRYRIMARLDAVETVTAPAGTFSGCHRISYTSTLDEGKATNRVVNLTVWFKPELGIVRTYSELGGSSKVTELIDFKVSN